ncbi:PREDICTED: uncharacterized protein K02A2.6-like [Vollenhovia emeryi]|uniref:uncharacterized protein K02A2.6-like n=1 Tax=Vollenhovia emeryi TaxID=411798 RepID=UPI0005F4E5F4|nr:PREDICTED: uncharacterized protein K02A2.6-like [Vollenhovia emeryi]
MPDEQKPILIPQLDPPKPFTFHAEDWNRWSQRWERYRRAAGLAQRSEEDQVNLLIYSMGDKADDILLSFKLSQEELKRYDTVIGKFKTHFGEKTNLIYERARFNQRRQDANENVDDFIADLFSLAETCNFGDLREELIRDRIVVGVRNTKLSEAMQLQADLTLERAITKARQADEVKRQQNVVRGSDASVSGRTEVDYVYQKGANRRYKTAPRQQQKGRPNDNASLKKCGRCGRTPQHAFVECPARQSACNHCKKKGHWETVCTLKKKKVSEVRSKEEISNKETYTAADSVFADRVRNKATAADYTPWRTTVSIEGIPVDFKIDSGADVSIIGEALRKESFSNISMQQPKDLRAVGNLIIPVKAMIEANMEWRGQRCKEKIYVVPGAKEPLLSRTAIEKMGIIRWVNAVTKKPEDRYPELFKGLGCLSSPYTLRLKEGARPYAITSPRRVAIPLREAVRRALNTMQKEGVISPVEEPTEWCAGMVVVPKPGGDVRICVDYTQLNKSVQREKHMLPVVDETLGRLAGAKIFTKLDACSGYYQIELNENSRRLTAFITPFGRFQFNRLPMGLTSAGEHFQRKISDILEGAEGVSTLMDDILVFGATEAEHDERLEYVLRRLRDNGITLNKSKCIFRTSSVKFLGHVISADKGVQPDPEKVTAVRELERPKSAVELRRFLGMVHYHLKFLGHLADIAQPLRDLLKKNQEYMWTAAHDQAFSKIKEMLSEAPTLVFFDPAKKSRVSADSSSYGLGAVLEQDNKGTWHPVSYASRGLTETEKRYAQIEKEALALTWACEKFSDYILGAQIILQTDHKPLVALLGSKPICELSARLQRFRMRLMRFSYEVQHVPGKELYTADTLSRAPQKQGLKEEDILFDQDVKSYVQAVEAATPIGDKLLQEVAETQKQDNTASILRRYIREGWPIHKADVDRAARGFFEHRGNLAELKDIIVYNTRAYIPTGGLRKQMLDRLHTGHLGITRCTDRAKEAV